MHAARRPDLAAEIAPRNVPEWIEYLQGWFEELRRTRAYDMNGPVAFTYPMIGEWARLTGREPEPYEVDALMMLDVADRAAAKKPIPITQPNEDDD